MFFAKEMTQLINKNTSDKRDYKRAARLFLSKQLWKEISDIINNNDENLVEYGKNIIKAGEAERIIKSIIRPIEKTITHIDNVISFVEPILKFDSNYADSEEMVNAIGNKVGIALTKDILSDIKSKDSAEEVIDLLDKSKLEEKEYRLVIDLLNSSKNNLTLRHGFGSDEFGDTPSIISFLKSIKEELREYKETVEQLAIEGDSWAISKVEFADWLKEQKKNGYIKLPYYEHLLVDMINKGRPGKVGQVVLKGHPGTGKTSIFSYKSEKEWRPHRIISMHQYINFYELIVQNTNLSPTKNQLEFFKEVSTDYEWLKPKELIERLDELFRINKSNFPNNYTLIDFINTIFNISRFIKDKAKISWEVLEAGDLENPEKIKKHILRMLNYRKDEKIYKLLLTKKESVKWEILDAMEKGENVVLDEIDKVQEKEIEWLLAFLDLNTGKYHQIQGMEEKIYIPEWFGVYATSNDKFKPAGPLGRRFNNIELKYLDKENLAHYIAAKISNTDLTTPFSEEEMNQIIKTIELIIENQDQEDYNALDFSVRMIDTFINNFISYRNHIVEKKHTNKRKEYIIDALIEAFESQTQDVYWGNKGGDTIDNQKENLIEKIKSAWFSTNTDEKDPKLTTGKRLNTSLQWKINTQIKNFWYDNPLLDLIIETKQKNDKTIEKRLLHYPEQSGELLNNFDKSLLKFNKSEIQILDTNPSGPFEVDEKHHSITYKSETKELTIITHKQWRQSKTEVLICDSLYTNEKKDILIAFWSTGDKYIQINDVKDSIISDLSERLHEMNSSCDVKAKINKIFFTTESRIIWSIRYHNGQDVLYSSDNNQLDIPSIENFKIYDWWLFFISHDKTSWMIGWLKAPTKENTSFFKETIEPMKAFLEFDLEDLWFKDHEISDIEFDTTKRYVLVHISKDNKSSILPIKL